MFREAACHILCAGGSGEVVHEHMVVEKVGEQPFGVAGLLRLLLLYIEQREGIEGRWVGRGDNKKDWGMEEGREGGEGIEGRRKE